MQVPRTRLEGDASLLKQLNKYEHTNRPEEPGARRNERAQERLALRDERKDATDSVRLSPAAFKMQLDSDIVRATFEITQEQVTKILEEHGLTAEDLFEKAGKSKYLESIANPTDTSPEATAGRILGGITGYIFGAWQLGRPNMTLGDFEEFEKAVLSGFERGLGEAKGIIDGQGKMNDELSSGIAKTEELVRAGLATFFEEQRTRLSSAASSGDDAPATSP